MNEINKGFLEILQRVQKEMPIVERDTKAFKYKYAPIETVWAKVEKIIADNGFVVLNEIQENGVLTRGLHEKGELKSFIPFSNENLKPQDKGSEITYYRRYNLTAMFNIIVAGEDDDATAPSQNAQKATVNVYETAKKAIEKETDAEKLKAIGKKVNNGKSLTQDQKDELLALIANKL